MSNRSNLRVRMGATASWTVLGLALICGGQAMAQTAPGAGDEAVPQEVAQDDTSQSDAIIVVGSRASQQSANNRKKNAKTATAIPITVRKVRKRLRKALFKRSFR